MYMDRYPQPLVWKQQFQSVAVHGSPLDEPFMHPLVVCFVLCLFLVAALFYECVVGPKGRLRFPVVGGGLPSATEADAWAKVRHSSPSADRRKKA